MASTALKAPPPRATCWASLTNGPSRVRCCSRTRQAPAPAAQMHAHACASAPAPVSVSAHLHAHQLHHRPANINATAAASHRDRHHHHHHNCQARSARGSRRTSQRPSGCRAPAARRSRPSCACSRPSTASSCTAAGLRRCAASASASPGVCRVRACVRAQGRRCSSRDLLGLSSPAVAPWRHTCIILVAAVARAAAAILCLYDAYMIHTMLVPAADCLCCCCCAAW